VLYEVLMTMAQLMAPFTPFFAEFLYQHLRKFEVLCTCAHGPRFNFHTQPNYNVTDESVPLDALGRSASVHFLMLPPYDESRCVDTSHKHRHIVLSMLPY
jgi:isoleucyl-tRNA synthetase